MIWLIVLGVINALLLFALLAVLSAILVAIKQNRIELIRIPKVIADGAKTEEKPRV